MTGTLYRDVLAVLQMAPRLAEFIKASRRVLYDADRNNGFLQLAVPALRSAVEQQRISPLRAALHFMRHAPINAVAFT